ncbi:MAG TPA: 6-bladed beta-propeller [Myxococcales bacterium]
MRKTAIAIILGSLALAGCATMPKPSEVVWPPPPDKARIRFVQAFNSSRMLDDTSWGKIRRAVFGDGKEVQVVFPVGLAISDDGKRLYIADGGHNKVLRADFERKEVTLMAPDEPSSGAFNVVLDADENVYFTDGPAKVVRVVKRDGTPLRVFGSEHLERPTGLALDRERKRLYVADAATRESKNHRVVVFDLQGTKVGEIGTKGDQPGEFYFPVYLALDEQGNLYVGDTMNFRIQVFNPEGQFVRMFGQNGDGPGSFDKLKGLAFDKLGNLYAVDGGHSNVQVFNKRFQPLTFFGGYARKLEYFDVPSAIAIDKNTNRIYVANEFIARVNVYELINTTAEDCGNAPTTPEASPAEVEKAPK